jgi:hypothetical protein
LTQNANKHLIKTAIKCYLNYSAIYIEAWKGECMRSASKWIILTIVAFFWGAGSGYCADVAKIGVVEFQRLFENSDAGKEIKAQITTQGKKMEAELKEKGAEIEEIKSAWSANPW